MDKFQVLQAFWESFGIPAYDENTIPSGDERPEMPYITYDVIDSDFDHPVAMSASLWYYGTSWSQITTKMTEIETRIGRGGTILPVDNGAVWIKKGSPFAQRMTGENDMIRQIFINVEAEYFTA